jgi:hypothetical protein
VPGTLGTLGTLGTAMNSAQKLTKKSPFCAKKGKKMMFCVKKRGHFLAKKKP